MYSPLTRSAFVKLPNELENSEKGLINIKNYDNKCFLWCHIRNLNLMSKNPQRITKDKNWLVVSIMIELNFLFQEKISVKLKNKPTFALMCFVLKMDWLTQFMNQAKNSVIAWISC